ncbi:hypothetical protein BSLG_000250 [Batrachochytrium salamandrivorans]|nr:hypothetical protein BSLG_000250 [Batrachochytrium salamandrivorans]
MAGTAPESPLDKYVPRLREILQEADLEIMSIRKLRQQVQTEFATDLGVHKESFQALVLSLIEETAETASNNNVSTKASNKASNKANNKANNKAGIRNSQADTDKKAAVSSSKRPSPAETDGDTESASGGSQQKRLKRAIISSKTVSDSIDDAMDAAPKEKKAKAQFLFEMSNELSLLLDKTDLLARSEVVKLIWAYIKANDLQDPSDKRFILCDEKLSAVMKVKRVGMFEMHKRLSVHLYPPRNPAKHSSDDRDANLSQDAQSDTPQSTKSASKPKPKKRAAMSESKQSAIDSNPFNRSHKLSDVMADLLGVDELSRPKIVKELWVYIKQHALQDPANKRIILCDAKMKRVFGVDRLDMFQMSKGIGSHLTKAPKPIKGEHKQEHSTDTDLAALTPLYSDPENVMDPDVDDKGAIAELLSQPGLLTQGST